jgi:hypothetical protein
MGLFAKISEGWRRSTEAGTGDLFANDPEVMRAHTRGVCGENTETLSAFGWVEGPGLLYLLVGPSPDHAADPRDSE